MGSTGLTEKVVCCGRKLRAGPGKDGLVVISSTDAAFKCRNRLSVSQGGLSASRLVSCIFCLGISVASLQLRNFRGNGLGPFI